MGTRNLSWSNLQIELLLRLPVLSLDVHVGSAHSVLQCISAAKPCLFCCACQRFQGPALRDGGPEKGPRIAQSLLRRAKGGANLAGVESRPYTEPCGPRTTLASESQGTLDPLCSVRMPGYSVEWECAPWKDAQG